MNNQLMMTSPMTRVLNAALNPRRHQPELDRCTWDRNPKADVLEGELEFRIAMELPGVSPDSLDISLENQTLSVKATRETKVPEGFELVRHERPEKSEFHRTFNLGNAVNAEGIEASFEQGILTLVLPKSKQSLPRKIEVK
ncbi:MAG: Hsp20/alpha crystallin family protein [bacterium]|nr:Hsp20/alpha crystallin family protein [bacterium]